MCGKRRGLPIRFHRLLIISKISIRIREIINNFPISILIINNKTSLIIRTSDLCCPSPRGILYHLHSSASSTTTITSTIIPTIDGPDQLAVETTTKGNLRLENCALTKHSFFRHRNNSQKWNKNNKRDDFPNRESRANDLHDGQHNNNNNINNNVDR